MDNVPLVRVFQRLGDLPRDRQGFIERNGSLRDALGQRRTLHQLHHQCAVFQPVNPRDIWVIEQGEDLSLTVESRQTTGVQSQVLRQELDRYIPIQPGISRPIYLAHSSRTDGCEDLVSSQAIARRKSHKESHDSTIVSARHLIPTPPTDKLAMRRSRRMASL